MRNLGHVISQKCHRLIADALSRLPLLNCRHLSALERTQDWGSERPSLTVLRASPLRRSKRCAVASSRQTLPRLAQARADMSCGAHSAVLPGEDVCPDAILRGTPATACKASCGRWELRTDGCTLPFRPLCRQPGNPAHTAA